MRNFLAVAACAASLGVVLAVPRIDSSTPAAVALGIIAIAVVAVAAAVLAVAYRPALGAAPGPTKTRAGLRVVAGEVTEEAVSALASHVAASFRAEAREDRIATVLEELRWHWRADHTAVETAEALRADFPEHPLWTALDRAEEAADYLFDSRASRLWLEAVADALAEEPCTS